MDPVQVQVKTVLFPPEIVATAKVMSSFKCSTETASFLVCDPSWLGEFLASVLPGVSDTTITNAIYANFDTRDRKNTLCLPDDILVTRDGLYASFIQTHADGTFRFKIK